MLHKQKKTLKQQLRRGFTLVEMLIVIVIIGLLAAALIPRIAGMQARARDTARKAHLNNIGTTLALYNADYGAFPAQGGDVETIMSGMVGTYINSIPTDPSAGLTFSGISDGAGCSGAPKQYRYTPIRKNGFNNAGAVLMAGAEEQGSSSNRVFDSAFTSGGMTAGCIGTNSDFTTLQSLICDRVGYGATNSLGSICTAVRNQAALRIIYMQ